jgi:hypothetical protein
MAGGQPAVAFGTQCAAFGMVAGRSRRRDQAFALKSGRCGNAARFLCIFDGCVAKRPGACGANLPPVSAPGSLAAGDLQGREGDAAAPWAQEQPR